LSSNFVTDHYLPFQGTEQALQFPLINNGLNQPLNFNGDNTRSLFGRALDHVEHAFSIRPTENTGHILNDNFYFTRNLGGVNQLNGQNIRNISP